MALRILAVDDDLNLCKNLKAFFELEKYDIETAHDGLAALEKVQKFHPHLVFLDINLGSGMSGIEVLKQIREKDPAVRVVMITGQADDESMRQARVLGVDEYVTKPFTLEYLNREVMKKVQHQALNDLHSVWRDLAVEREKVEFLFDKVNEGVILVNPQGFMFMENPVARAILGLPEDTSTLVAQKVFEAFTYDPPDRLQRLEAETGEAFDIRRETPRLLILECRIHPIFHNKKDRFGFMFLFRDVTLERKADTAMHHFISLISHKLRTPLVTIRAYPRLLLSENAISPMNDFQRNALQVIAKQCRLMEDMVNQLIAFSALDPEELLCQRMSVTELVTEALKLMPEDMKDKVSRVKSANDLANFFVHVDPTLMQHAMRNLIENAFKFGATQLEIQAERQKDAVVVTFSDDGPGIPPEDRERVFERFYQVEKTFCGQVPGAGLGLTMVKQTVEAHGGQVWVESQLGKGSSFSVKLPSASNPS